MQRNTRFNPIARNASDFKMCHSLCLMKLHYSYFMLMGVLKNFGVCTAAGIAAAVPSSIAIQYWGGTTYRGFLNFDILVLSLIFAGFRYVQGKIRFLAWDSAFWLQQLPFSGTGNF